MIHTFLRAAGATALAVCMFAGSAEVARANGIPTASAATTSDSGSDSGQIPASYSTADVDAPSDASSVSSTASNLNAGTTLSSGLFAAPSTAIASTDTPSTSGSNVSYGLGSVSPNNAILTDPVVVTPEPGTFGLAAALMSLGMISRRARRKA